MVMNTRTSIRSAPDQIPLAVSLKTLARRLDAHRSSVRRWLREAGIHPVVLGRGRNGAIRYRWEEVRTWLQTREYVP
ncbi:MAG: helix-turn-helix domain-containing protein [Phycisphaerae bacterium]